MEKWKGNGTTVRGVERLTRRKTGLILTQSGRHGGNEASSSDYLVQNAVEVVAFDRHELAVGDLRAQHSAVSARRVLAGTRYR